MKTTTLGRKSLGCSMQACLLIPMSYWMRVLTGRIPGWWMASRDTRIWLSIDRGYMRGTSKKIIKLRKGYLTQEKIEVAD